MPMVVWALEQKTEVSTPNELRPLLRQLQEQAARSADPFSVIVTLDNGDSLTAGFGRPVSVLNYMNGSHTPPYYQSFSDERLWEDEIIEFEFGGELTEYPGEAAVPIEEAAEALVHFMETGGQLTDRIQWIEV
jgi:hypothetical protein